MLRLIVSRWVRLAVAAVAAVAVAAIVVTVVRLRRRPVRPGPAISEVASGDEAGEAENASEPRWPPVPILGIPTDDDLRRYAVGPSALERFFRDLPPRVPLDEATRSRLARWVPHSENPVSPRETGRGNTCLPAGYLFGGTGLPPGRKAGGGKRSLRICSARMAA
jgi:hypothetical protein